MRIPREHQRTLLQRVARRAMIERGLEPDFPDAVMAEVAALSQPAAPHSTDVRDLRHLPWCSIDNDDSRDLDQLTAAAPHGGDSARIWIAVADVSATVAQGSALDQHAGTNTTSVYTPPQNFPMLPDRLSTDLTSLGPHQDRLAMIVELIVDPQGTTDTGAVYQALVRNHAKLAYSGVGPWLEGRAHMPAALAAVPGLAENLRLQDQAAQRLKDLRHERGALALETIEVRAQFAGDAVDRLVTQPRCRSKELIEDFMIAANGAIARFLAAHHLPVLRRVVRAPERWDRIVELARSLGEPMAPDPDARALNRFLLRRRAADPQRFADLSLSIIKLLGRGEYAASFPGEELSGHFGLAVSEYTHSTAPNRRLPDLITQRLLKAALSRRGAPYTPEELVDLAARCTRMENNAQKVERLVRKAAAACLLSDRGGEVFDAIITGASPKGTWARLLDPPVEGRVVQGEAGLDVGDALQVTLLRADPERGFIDLARAHPAARMGSHMGDSRSTRSRSDTCV